jgi:hypothetical protein
MHAEITTEANGVVSRRSLLIGAVGAGVLPILSRHAFARSVQGPGREARNETSGSGSPVLPVKSPMHWL